jgi:hypothetical protein
MDCARRFGKLAVTVFMWMVVIPTVPAIATDLKSKKKIIIIITCWLHCKDSQSRESECRRSCQNGADTGVINQKPQSQTLHRIKQLPEVGVKIFLQQTTRTDASQTTGNPRNKSPCCKWQPSETAHCLLASHSRSNYNIKFATHCTRINSGSSATSQGRGGEEGEGNVCVCLSMRTATEDIFASEFETVGGILMQWLLHCTVFCEPKDL